MNTATPGQLVTIAGSGPDLHGIVFHAPSKNKIVVAVVTPGRGPGFVSVHPSALSERTEPATDDRTLQLLIRRTPQPIRGGVRGGSAGGHGSRGHTRGAAHRATGR